jgi:hypothetical protein
MVHLNVREHIKCQNSFYQYKICCGHNISCFFNVLPLLTDIQKTLSGLVPAIEKARLYRGKGGEIMRAAVSRFIECISLSKISINEKTKKSLLDTLNENLKHPNFQIQVCNVQNKLPYS